MEPKNGQLRVWWIPQVPMTAFHVEVSTPKEGKKILNILADYDLFQLKHNIKPDYSNVGGMSVFLTEEDLGWCEWEDKDGYDIWETETVSID
jgi:hypothetical protein